LTNKQFLYIFIVILLLPLTAPANEVDLGLESVLGADRIAPVKSPPAAPTSPAKETINSNLAAQSIAKKDVEIKGLTAEIKRLHKRLAFYQDETVAAKSDTKIAQLQSKALSKSLSSAREQLDKLDKYRELSLSLTDLRSLYKDLKKGIYKKTKASKALDKNISASNSKIASLKTEIQAVKQSIFELSKLQSSLVSRLKIYPKKIRAYQEAISSLKSEFTNVLAWQHTPKVKLLTVASVDVPTSSGPKSTPSAYLEFNGRLKKVLTGSYLGKWLVSEISLDRILLESGSRYLIITTSPVIKDGSLSGTINSNVCAPPQPLDKEAEANAAAVIADIEKRFSDSKEEKAPDSVSKPKGASK